MTKGSIGQVAAIIAQSKSRAALLVWASFVMGQEIDRVPFLFPIRLQNRVIRMNDDGQDYAKLNSVFRLLMENPEAELITLGMTRLLYIPLSHCLYIKLI